MSARANQFPTTKPPDKAVEEEKKLLPSLSALTRTNKIYTIRDERVVSQSVEVSVQCMCCSAGWLFY